MAAPILRESSIPRHIEANEYHVHVKDRPVLEYFTPIAPTEIRSDFDVEYFDGEREHFAVRVNSFSLLSTTRNFDGVNNTNEQSGPAMRQMGWIRSIHTYGIPAPTQFPGMFYARVGVRRGALTIPFASGYIHLDQPFLPFGSHQKMGPAGGPGRIRQIALATDVAGNVDTFTNLRITDGYRIVRGVVLFYIADATVATRTMRIFINKLGGADPTNFDADLSMNWISPTLTLTASEQGKIGSLSFEGKDAYTFTDDNGTLAVSNTTTAPSIFPLHIREDNLGEIAIDITTGQAGDRYSAYLWTEDWQGVPNLG